VITTSKQTTLLIIAGIILLLYFLPFLILQENSYFTLHDNLDGLYVYHHLLAMTGQTYNFNPDVVIGNVMSGLPRSAFGSGLNIVPTLFFFFKPSTAYIINFILAHVIGFVGMFLLLHKHILVKKNQWPIVLACSILFAFIPFYSIYGACVPYQPLLLYSFLNLLIVNKKYLTDYFIILFYPLYSTTVLVEPFVFICLSSIFLIKTIQDRKFYFRYFLGLCLLFIMTVIVDLPVIYQNLFNPDFISSRIEFKTMDLLGTDNYKVWWINSFFSMLFKTHYHTGTFYVFPIIAAGIVAVVIFIKHKNYNNPALYLIFFIFFCSILYASYPLLVSMLGNKIHLLKIYQFDRFYFLLPVTWIILFAYYLKEICAGGKKLNFLGWSLISVQFLIILGCNIEVKENIRLVFNMNKGEPDCKKFFSENIFNEIRNYIGIPQKEYKVVSIGMHPSVSLYNGFYTLDGYQYVYDLRYKHTFRQIISSELDKDNSLKDYFDKWGGRCYIFSSELGRSFLCGKDSHKEINDLNINYQVLKKMNCRYILSAVRINNINSSVVKFEKKFEGKDSYWDIYLYKLL
jgi:hypothetical protein